MQGAQTGPGKLAIGAERQTVIEQFVSLLRIPYVLGCFTIALIAGPAGLVLTNYLDSFNLDKAIGATLNPYSPRNSWTGVLDLATNTVIIFSMLFMTKYMRRKVVMIEPRLVDLLPEGRTALDSIFGRISQVRPQLVTTLVLFILIQLASSVSISSLSSVGPVSMVSAILSLLLGAIFYLTVGSFVWVYSSSLWSLHKLGGEPLKLKPFYMDSMLGVGTIGSLSLSLCLAYYTVFGPVALETLVLSPDIAGYAAIVPLVSLGGIMFFLPLYSIRAKMLRTRREEEKRLGQQRVEVFEKYLGSARVPEQLERILSLQMLQLAERELDQVPTWPFDSKTLERFGVMFFGVLSAVLGGVILLALHL